MKRQTYLKVLLNEYPFPLAPNVQDDVLCLISFSHKSLCNRLPMYLIEGIVYLLFEHEVWNFKILL